MSANSCGYKELAENAMHFREVSTELSFHVNMGESGLMAVT
jgi:hypothetical protein